MLYFLDSADERWSRLLFILSSVQLIVFVAAGVVFGMAIQNQRSAESERRADAAEQRAAAFRTQADQYRQAATNGRVLAEVAKAQQALRNGRRGGSAADPATVAQSDAVGDLARRLFPD
jgi:type II secretory pathway pseudopilin PulG